MKLVMGAKRVQQSKIKRGLVRGFLAVEAGIYLIFLWIDLHQEFPWLGSESLWKVMPWYGNEILMSNEIKFLGIVLCCVFSLFTAVFWNLDRIGNVSIRLLSEQQKDSLLQSAALLLTVGADICLLLTDRYAAGVGIFLLVQSIYLYRIESNPVVRTGRRLLLRLAAGGGLLCLLLWARVRLEAASVLAVFYFVSFTDNLFLLFHRRNLLRHAAFRYSFFAGGMVLFYICDISVGLFNLSSYLPELYEITAGAAKIAGAAIWLFYLPGQILLALSGGILDCNSFTKDQ